MAGPIAVDLRSVGLDRKVVMADRRVDHHTVHRMADLEVQDVPAAIVRDRHAAKVDPMLIVDLTAIVDQIVRTVTVDRPDQMAKVVRSGVKRH